MSFNDSTRTKRAFANPTSIGSNTLVSAYTNGKIRVLGMLVIAAAANTATIMSGSTDISADMALAVNGGFTLPMNKDGWFETAVGEALNMNLTAATAVGVTIVYEIV